MCGVALAMQHGRRTLHILLSCAACPSVLYFATLSNKRHNYQEKIVRFNYLKKFSF